MNTVCTLELQERLWSLILLWHGWEMGMFVLGLTPACSEILTRKVYDRLSQSSNTRTARNSIYIRTTPDLRAQGRSSL